MRSRREDRQLQSRRSLTFLVHGRLHHSLDAVAREATVVAHSFEFQQSPVDVAAQALQIGQVGQAFVHFKILGIAEDAFGAQAAPFLERLFQVKLLVLDVQARMDPLLHDPSAKGARRRLRDPAVKEELQAMGPARVQVLTHHLFKEFSPLLRAIEDLGQAHRHLPDRQLPVVAGLPILRTQGQRQAVQPLAEQALDVLRTHPVLGLRQLSRVGTGEKAVVQRLKSDALLLQLALRAFVSVQAQFQAPEGIAADLQEDWPEVFVVDIEVVVIDIAILSRSYWKAPPSFRAEKVCAFSWATPMNTTWSRTPRCWPSRWATSSWRSPCWK